MKMCKASVPLLVIFAVAFLASSGTAQVGAPLKHGSLEGKARSLAKAIHVDVNMVLVNVGVTNPEDRPITNLQKEDFRLFEDKVEQEIVTFSREDVPISAGVIFDTSGSMAEKIDRSREAVMQILKAANPQDEFLLVTFAGHPKLTSGFTSNIEEIQSRIASTMPGGPTALLDAIHLGMTEMKHARYSKCALVVISDGGDNHSWHTEGRIRKDLKEAGCQLYSIGIFDEQGMKKWIEERNGPELLSGLADVSGGRAFRVSSLDELPRIAGDISVGLRSQYVLGYKPNGARHAGAWRSIKIKVASPASLQPVHIYARSGYYSPPQ